MKMPSCRLRESAFQHLAAGDADAAVTEMEVSLKRLQRNYLSHAAACGQKKPA